MRNPIVTMNMVNGKTIKLEMYPEHAPNTVDNFIHLIQEKFYDNTIFHRVINGFMIQGGDPKGTGMGGPGYHIKGEFKTNGSDNNLGHKRGIVSMARANHPDSAGSQFFIMHQDAPHLDGQYAAFGQVIDGMDVVDDIADTKVNHQDKPISEQKVLSMSVVLNGYEQKEPMIIND